MGPSLHTRIDGVLTALIFAPYGPPPPPHFSRIFVRASLQTRIDGVLNAAQALTARTSVAVAVKPGAASFYSGGKHRH